MAMADRERRGRVVVWHWLVSGRGGVGGVWAPGNTQNGKYQLPMMKRKQRWIQPLVGTWLLLVSVPLAVEACSTCFGVSDSDMARGMNMGIFTLLGFLAFVLSILVAFFVFIGVRAAKTDELSEDAEEDTSGDDRV
jgi:hypothetical protein